ncbi:Kinesin light chain 3 [Rhizophlyctis rosea]|nr:Kinesin light chain 3 [Rhizophlyctis rosea]
MLRAPTTSSIGTGVDKTTSAKSTVAASLSPDDSQSLPLLGVRLSYFNVFVEKWGGKHELMGLTTEDVCNKFVHPLTSPGRSLCSHLVEEASKVSTVDLANYFISHPWKYPFLTVVDAIQSFFTSEGLTATDPIIWFDVFSLPQHGRQQLDTTWLKRVFINAIANIGNVVMVLAEWSKPFPLTRTWCLFELFACNITNSTFFVAMPQDELSAFHDTVPQEPDLFYDQIEFVTKSKAENSTAAEKADLDAIRNLVGFDDLDRAVIKIFVQWLVEQFRAQLELQERKADEFEEFEYGFRDWRFSIGAVYKGRAMYAEAKRSFIGSMVMRERWFGHQHPSTIICLHQLARVYVLEGRYEDAESLYIDGLERAQEALGGKDAPDMLFLHHGIGIFYACWGKQEVADAWFQRCAGKSVTISTAVSRTKFLAGNTSGDSVKVEEMLESLVSDSVETATEGLRANHLETLTALNHLATIYHWLGNTTKAMQLLNDLTIQASDNLGDHPLTQTVIGSQSFLLGHMTTHNYPTAGTNPYRLGTKPPPRGYRPLLDHTHLRKLMRHEETITQIRDHLQHMDRPSILDNVLGKPGPSGVEGETVDETFSVLSDFSMTDSSDDFAAVRVDDGNETGGTLPAGVYEEDLSTEGLDGATNMEGEDPSLVGDLDQRRTGGGMDESSFDLSDSVETSPTGQNTVRTLGDTRRADCPMDAEPITIPPNKDVPIEVSRPDTAYGPVEVGSKARGPTYRRGKYGLGRRTDAKRRWKEERCCVL